MRLVHLGLTAAFCAGLALPVAAASPAFDAFARVCGDTHVDYSAIVNALDFKVWKPTPVTSATMDGATVSDKVSRGATIGDTPLTLFAWKGTKGPYQFTACTIRVSGGKLDAFTTEAQAWAGFAPQTAEAKKANFRFIQEGGARKAVEKAEYEAAAAGAGLEFLTVSQDGPDTILDLLKIKK